MKYDELALKVIQSAYDYEYTGFPEMSDSEWDKACLLLVDNWDDISINIRDRLGPPDALKYTGSGIKHEKAS